MKMQLPDEYVRFSSGLKEAGQSFESAGWFADMVLILA